MPERPKPIGDEHGRGGAAGVAGVASQHNRVLPQFARGLATLLFAEGEIEIA